MEHPHCLANPTRVHGHINGLALHVRRLTGVDIVQQERATRPALLSATVPLLALAGLVMADDIRALTVGIMEAWADHDATQSPWDY